MIMYLCVNSAELNCAELNCAEPSAVMRTWRGRGGLAFTLPRINMFGKSNSAHLTSLCVKKRGRTFDNDIFHMIWMKAKKSALWKALKPRQIVCWLHNNRRPLAVSSGSPWRNSFGKLILHFHGSPYSMAPKKGRKRHKKTVFTQMYLLSASFLKHSLSLPPIDAAPLWDGRPKTSAYSGLYEVS